ncbi:MAG: extracellular solute-binding protein [Bacillus subtilis]|nr:extracellular solute-binding protein [Bacillus subtilis]
MQTLLNRYEQETGVKITLVSTPYNEYEQRLATMISGGQPPHLARVTEGHLNNFQEQILDLDKVFDSTQFKNLFFNNDGKVIALPMDITANGMFINKTLLDKYDVNYPALGDPVWTWAEFETEMNKLRNKDDVTAPGIFDHQAHRFMPLFYQNGVQLWDTPYTTSNLTSSAAVATVQKLMDWYDNGFLSNQTYVVKNSAAEFRKGTYGFHMSGNWNVSAYQNLTFQWTVVPMPKGTNRATILGGKSMAAFVNSGAEKEAKAFITWLSEGVNHDQYTNGVPYLTPRLGAQVNYGPYAEQYNVFLDEIANTSNDHITDWLDQVMIPGMYPIINLFVENAANPNRTKTAIQLLQDLEAELKGIMD